LYSEPFFAPQINVFVNICATISGDNYRNLKSEHWRSSIDVCPHKIINVTPKMLRGRILDNIVKLS